MFLEMLQFYLLFLIVYNENDALLVEGRNFYQFMLKYSIKIQRGSSFNIDLCILECICFGCGFRFVYFKRRKGKF